MTKIILANILWCILFSTLLNFSNGLMDYDEITLRKFPYVMSPTPFKSRLTRDVQDVLNQMAKGDDGSQGASGDIQNSFIENQIQDQHNHNNIGSEQILPPQSQYQYTSPQMYGQQNSYQQQSQSNIRQALESEAVHHHHHNHQEQNQQNSQQQEQQQIQNTLKWNQPDLSLQNQIQQQIQQHVQQQIQEQQLQQQQVQQFQQQQLHQQHLQQLQQQQLQQQQIQQHQLQQQQFQQHSLQQQQQQPQIPLYNVPPQIHNQIQSIYQSQQPIPTQNSISYSYNQNHMSAPFPPKMEVVQPSLAYLPSTLQPPSVTSTPTPPPPPPPTPTPLLPTTQTPTPIPTPPPPMVNITPKPRISKTYIPVMPPTSPKPTKAVITNIYSYDSPTDSDEDASAEEPEVPSRQHYKILFIRAPNQISKNTIRRAHSQHQNQQKTVVYILSKKTDVSEIRDALQYLPTTTSKPEVHFIRYKTEDEAEHAKHQIQHHYHQLSDSTQYSNEGTPLITSAIGILPRSEADTPNNVYLPPIQQNNDLGYLPPALPSSQPLESTPDSEYLPPSK